MATTTGGGGALATCFLVALAAATVTLTTQPQPAAAYGRQASTPTAQFVQSICNTTVVGRVYVAYCYDMLVEGRESFMGSHIKVVGAAISHMVTDLGTAATELREFKAATDPAGAEYDLAPCIAVGEEAVRDAGGGGGPPVPAVAKLRSLEAAGDDGGVAQQDLDALDKWVDKVVDGVKFACVADAFYVNPNSKDIADDDRLPTLKLLDYDVSVCTDLVRNYNKYAPAAAPAPQQKAQS